MKNKANKKQSSSKENKEYNVYTEEITGANGEKIVVYHHEPIVPKSEKVDDELDDFLEQLFTSTKKKNNLYTEIEFAISENNYDLFKEGLKNYLNFVIKDEIEKEDPEKRDYNERIKTIQLFLDALENKKLEHIDRWINFLEKDDRINKENICLSLWMRSRDEEVKNYLDNSNNKDIEISEKHYDSFFGVFEKYMDRIDSVFSTKSINQIKDERKQYFLQDMMKLVFKNKLEGNLDDTKSSKRKNKL